MPKSGEVIKAILKYGKRHPVDLSILAEWAGLSWENKASIQWIVQHQDVFERAIKDNILQRSNDGFECVNYIYFEYLYAVIFSKDNFHLLNGDWEKFYNETWQKRYRAKSKRLYELQSDFTSLTIIALSDSHGLKIIDLWIDDIEIHFGKHHISLENILPYIDSTVEQLTALGIAIAENSKHSLNKFALAIRATISGRTNIANDLEEKFRLSGNDNLVKLIPWILLGLIDENGIASISVRLTNQLRETDIKMEEALFALGLAKVDQINWDKCGNEISNELNKLRESENINIHVQILNVLRNLQPYTTDFADYIIELSKFSEIEYRSAVIEALWLTSDTSCLEHWFEKTFLNIDHVDVTLKGLIEEIIYILYPVAEKNPTLFADYLDRWIVNENNTIKSVRFFDDVISTFFTRHSDEASKWLTKALMNSNDRFHRSLFHIISELWIDGIKYLTLHKQTLDTCTPSMIRFILFKICGYIYSKEPLESLVYSLLSRTPFRDDVTNMVGDMFIQHITYQYGGTNTYLREQLLVANESQVTMIKRVLEFNDNYNEEVQKIRKIKELKLSIKSDVDFKKTKIKRLSENMKVNKDERRKNSILDLVKKVSIKGGRAFFNKYNQKYNPPSKMGHFESSFEMPMGEAIDMVKDKMNILYWKQFKLPK